MPNSRLDPSLPTPCCTWKGELPCPLCEGRCPYNKLPDVVDPDGYYAEDFGASYEALPDEPMELPAWSEEPPPEEPAAPALTLSPEQRSVVEHVDGPALVTAGAGSGKTRSLTERVSHMIQRAGIQPAAIVVVTFTRKATAELRGRISNALGARQARLVTISTFHGLALGMLREHPEQIGRRPNFTVFDDGTMTSEIRRILKEVWGSDPAGEEEPAAGALFPGMVATASDRDAERERCRKRAGPPPSPGDLLGALSEQKEKGGELDEAFYEACTVRWPPDGGRVLREYEDVKLAANAVDFDDLVYLAWRMLRNDPELAAQYRARWTHFMVDEYQDTNDLQERLIQVLVGERGNVMVVGDDDQSIYSFRGANVKHILSFPDRWPGTRILPLGRNYRSTGNVVSAAAKLIGHNRKRYDKRIWTENAPGWEIEVYEHKDAPAEADYIVRAVQGSIQHGYAVGQHAVLVRTRRQFTLLQTAFTQAKIPFTTVGALNYWERSDVRIVLSWLRSVENQRDFVSGAYALGHWPLVGAQTVRAWLQYAERGDRPMWGYLTTLRGQRGCGPSTKKGQSLARFAENMEELERRMLSEVPLAEVVRWLYEVTELDAQIEEALQGSGVQAEEARERLRLRDDVVAAAPTSGGLVALREYLDSIVQAASRRKDQDCVTLITVHSAKGAEWDMVWVAGFTEGLMPCLSFKDGRFSEPQDDAIEEERRLAYVAITRARLRLVVNYYERLIMQGQEVWSKRSRFLDEILGVAAPAPIERAAPVRRETPPEERPSPEGAVKRRIRIGGMGASAG